MRVAVSGRRVRPDVHPYLDSPGGFLGMMQPLVNAEEELWLSWLCRVVRVSRFAGESAPRGATAHPGAIGDGCWRSALLSLAEVARFTRLPYSIDICLFLFIFLNLG